MRARIIGFVEKKFGGCAPQFIFRLSNGGERSRENARELDVIVAYQSYVSRYGDTALEEGAHHSEREEIIGAKNSGRLGRGAQELLRALLALLGGLRRGADIDKSAVRIKARGPYRLERSTSPVCNLADTQWAMHKGNTSVSLFKKMR